MYLFGTEGSNPSLYAMKKQGIIRCPAFSFIRTALSEGFEGDRAKIETRSRFDRRQKQSGGLFLGRALIALIIQPGDPKTRSIQSYTITYSLYAMSNHRYK